MRRLPVLAAAGAVTLAGGLAACGGSSTGAAPADPAAVLTRAYTQTVAAKTADVTFSLKERAGGRTVDVNGTGAFDWGARQGSLALTVQVPGGQGFSIQEVVANSAVYARFPAPIAQALGITAPWVKVPVATGGALTAGPNQTLQLLASQSSGVTRVGPATVDGVATTEYQASVDPTKMARSLPSGLKTAFSTLATSANLTSIPIVAYIDSAGRAVRMTSTITVTTPASASTGGASQTVTTDELFDFSHYGAPVSVSLPPADQVGSSSQLNSLFGG